VKLSPATASALVFLASLLVAVVAVVRLPALGAMGGTTDEHFALGLKLRVTGTIGVSADEPTTLRPPGYPALVAMATAALAPPPSKVSSAVFDRAAEHAVYFAQALLLAVGSTLLYLWLRPTAGPWIAAGAALAFATCPAVLVLCTLLHYSMLHAVLLLAVCVAVGRTLEDGTDRAAVLTGLLTGAANLVRPVTLWLPAFAALALWCRFGTRRAVRSGILMLLTSLVVMTPWTVRNYRLSGRVLPVGDTGWHTLWAQTVRPLSPDPDRYVHFNLHADIDRLFRAITGAPQYDYLVHVRQTGAVEQGFRADALANIRRQPRVYAANVARSLASLVFRSSVVYVRATDALRGQRRSRDRNAVPQEWLRPGAPDVGAQWMAVATSVALALTGLLAAAGIAWSARRREPFGLTVLAVAGCVLATHALAFVSMMHHYLRLPFLFAGAAIALQAARAHGGRVYAAAAALAIVAVILSLLVTAALMFAPA
jgi:hypothetical protein